MNREEAMYFCGDETQATGYAKADQSLENFLTIPRETLPLKAYQFNADKSMTLRDDLTVEELTEWVGDKRAQEIMEEIYA